MSATTKKLIKKFNDIMRELYLKSEPSADWDKMLEEAPIMEDGRKFIDYTKYYLDNEEFTAIFQKHTKGMRKHTKRDLTFAVYLGCSPTSYKKRNNEE